MNIKKFLILPLACCGLAAPVVAGTFVNGNAKNVNAEDSTELEDLYNAIKDNKYYCSEKLATLTITGESYENAKFSLFSSANGAKDKEWSGLPFDSASLKFGGVGMVPYCYIIYENYIDVSGGAVTAYTGDYYLIIEHAEEKFCDKDGHKAYYECNDVFYENSACSSTIGDSEDLSLWLADSGRGKIEALGHDNPDQAYIQATMSTCFKDGNYGYYYCSKCKKYFSDYYLENEIEDLETWKITDGEGKMSKRSHSMIPIDGKAPTCTEDGYKASYKCEFCEFFFEDEEGTVLIGEDTELFNWFVGAGKIPAHHSGVKQDGKAATTTEDGWKDYYKCSGCDEYFEDSDCLHEITDLEAWKAGAGKIEKLPEPQPEPQPEPAPEKLGAGAIVGISVGSVVGVSLITYLVMFVVFLKKNKAPKFLIKSFETLAKLFKK